MEKITVVFLLCAFATVIRAKPHTFTYNADCVLTLEMGGHEIIDGADVSIALGSDLQVFCNAFCTGSGVSPALHWFKENEQVSSNLERVYYESTTFERNSVLHVLHSLYRDLGNYTCRGWLKGLGWREKSFRLIPQCPDDKVRCDAHKCIDRSSVCDGHFDCEDRSDEARCLVCEANEFECDDKCMDRRFLCDYIQDCADGFDESDCETRNCTDDEYTCGDGRCIPVTYRCDNFTDCADESDEHNCCPEGTLRCEDGECIKEIGWCDGNFDCMDLTDELDCGDNNDEEIEEEDTVPPCNGFVCGNGECLPSLLQCDGRVDCWDGTDEEGCGSSTATPDIPVSTDFGVCTDGFQCDNGACIPAEYECDDFVDCLDFSDEHAGCAGTDTPPTPSSTESTTRPTTASTTPEAGTDTPPTPSSTESTTRPTTASTTSVGTDTPPTTPTPTEPTTPPTTPVGTDTPPPTPTPTEPTTPTTTTPGCSIDEFRCSDGSCIPDVMLCNSVPDCPDEEDENLPECRVVTCPENQRQCADQTHCYSSLKHCDGEDDCDDGSDERGCHSQ